MIAIPSRRTPPPAAASLDVTAVSTQSLLLASLGLSAALWALLAAALAV